MDGNGVFRCYINRYSNNLRGGHCPRDRGAGTSVQVRLARNVTSTGYTLRPFRRIHCAQVWGDNDRANAALGREASALRAAVVLAAGWAEEPQARLRTFICRYITEAVNVEWPLMAKKTANLSVVPQDLSDALELTLSLTPSNQGQQVAQREIVTELDAALAARRERIILSWAQVNPLKWSALLVQAVCALLAIAFVHCDNRLSSALMMGLFATGVATSLLLIAAHDRPFLGELKVRPDPLLQIMLEAPRSRTVPPVG